MVKTFLKVVIVVEGNVHSWVKRLKKFILIETLHFGTLHLLMTIPTLITMPESMDRLHYIAMGTAFNILMMSLLDLYILGHYRETSFADLRRKALKLHLLTYIFALILVWGFFFLVWFGKNYTLLAPKTL